MPPVNEHPSPCPGAAAHRDGPARAPGILAMVSMRLVPPCPDVAPACGQFVAGQMAPHTPRAASSAQWPAARRDGAYVSRDCRAHTLLSIARRDAPALRAGCRDF